MPASNEGGEPEEGSKVECEQSVSCDDTVMAEEGEKSKTSKKHRSRKRQMYAEVRKQMEFYFSDANITKDRMMKQMVQDSEYVDLSVFLNFNKVSSKCKDVESLQRALKESEKLELSPDLNAVKRKIPFDETKAKSETEVENCTIYVENVPSHVNHDWIEEVFQEFGTVAYISLPKYRRTGCPKGFAFVEYEEEEGARRCLEAFGGMGACLPNTIDPAGLVSINTYAGEGNNTQTGIQEPEEHEDDKCDVASECPSAPSKPSKSRGRKRAGTKDESDCAPKREKSAGESLESPVSASPPMKKVENDEPARKSSEMEVQGDDSSVAVTTKKTRKRVKKRKQKKNEEKIRREEKLESESIQLRILPKKHWRQLRNRYLNTQRETMAKLKRELKLQRFALESETDITGLSREPDEETLKAARSICVKIELDTPAKSAEVFKEQIGLDITPTGWPNFVRFIDYNDGGLDAIVRLASSDEGIQIFLDNANRIFKKATLFTEEETTNYWKSVKVEQALKKKELKTKNTRGKDRLLNRVEKLANQNHIRFDDELQDNEDNS